MTTKNPKERPILFSGPMVRAILEGRKTQTRRIVKGTALDWLKPDNFTPEFVANPENHLCPYGQPGDRLWVKETWRPRSVEQPWDLEIKYAADGVTRTIRDGEFGDKDWNMPKAAAKGNVSPLFMTRWASRLDLPIVGVRVERLQDITEADAQAEGATPSIVGGDLDHLKYRAGFQSLWESINGAESWQANPWVWVVEFNKIEK